MCSFVSWTAVIREETCFVPVFRKNYLNEGSRNSTFSEEFFEIPVSFCINSCMSLRTARIIQDTGFFEFI